VFFRSRILGLVWIGVGIAIAWRHHYFNHLSTVRQLGSALLAIVLWPLLLLGINLHIKR
jgi:hypothetical protein